MKLDARLRNMERKRARLLDRVEAMESGLLTGHPRDGKWSVLEIVEHLVLSEEDVCVDLHGLDALVAEPRRMKDRIGYLIVMFVLRFDIPVAAPSDAMLPTGTRSLAELRERWEENHRRLGAFVGGLDRAAANRAILRHPIAGPMTVAQGLRMLEVHLDRHIRQIETLERLDRGREA